MKCIKCNSETKTLFHDPRIPIKDRTTPDLCNNCTLTIIDSQIDAHRINTSKMKPVKIAPPLYPPFKETGYIHLLSRPTHIYLMLFVTLLTIIKNETYKNVFIKEKN
jgi:hypothetical protein